MKIVSAEKWQVFTQEKKYKCCDSYCSYFCFLRESLIWRDAINIKITVIYFLLEKSTLSVKNIFKYFKIFE